MIFPTYPECKDSGVEWLGDVPSHWNVKRLRFVVQINPSKGEVASLEPSTEVSFLPMEAIGENGSIDLERTRVLEEVGSGYTYFREGDVAIAKITPCFENGKGAIMRGLLGGIGFGTTELIVARPNIDQTCSDFIHWLFTSVPFRCLGEAVMYGAGGQKRVPDDFIRNFSIALPCTQEQSAIVAFLNHETAKIDALIAEQEKLIELLKEKRQAVISHAVTKGLDPNVPMKDSGVEWLGEVPEHWTIHRIKDVATFSGGGTPSREIAHYWGGDIPWVSPKDMKVEEISETDESITEEGLVNSAASIVAPDSVLIVVRSGILRHTIPVAITTHSVSLNQDMKSIALKQEQCLSRFLLRWIQGLNTSLLVAWQKQGATVESIEHAYFENSLIALPPLNEQHGILLKIDSYLSKIKGLLFESKKAIDLLKERRSALISAAVTGKIDVRGFAPVSEAV